MIVNLPKANLEIPNKRIGISISGGADSAILSYIMMKYCEADLYFFTTANLEKSFITVRAASAVLAKCVELTKKVNIHHHIDYVSKFDRTSFFKNLEDKVDQGHVDVVYTATTNIPSLIERSKFLNQLEFSLANRRTPTKVKPFYSQENKFYHPFINIDKKDIKEMYNEFGVLDELFPVTRSCESSTELDHHCGKCWWCEERMWAFGRLE